jgi:hypothetical protein
MKRRCICSLYKLGDSDVQIKVSCRAKKDDIKEQGKEKKGNINP